MISCRHRDNDSFYQILVSCTKFASLFQDRWIWNFTTPKQNWHHFFYFFLPQKIFNKSIISLKELKLEHVRIFLEILFQYSSKIQPDVENFENNISFVL